MYPGALLYGVIDLRRRDYAFFHKPVRDHRHDRPVEEVQDPVVNSAKADAQFLNPVSQEVRLGPTQFVAHLTQPLQPEVALVLYLRWQFVEPLHERA